MLNKKGFFQEVCLVSKLKVAVQAYWFWRLKLKQANGQNISQEVLIRHASKGRIPLQLVTNTDVSYIVQNIKLSYHNLTDMQSQHANLRASFLEDLAEAIVLRHYPCDSSNSMEAIKDRTAKQLKQLRFREKMRKSYRKIANTFAPG